MHMHEHVIRHNSGNAADVFAFESIVTILGVVYVHRKTGDGGDIYLTKYGQPLADVLQLKNWYEARWFRERRQKLLGTSAVFRVPTKAVGRVALDLVVKNCRVGEDVPLDTHTLEEFINAEFNSPWEEFALVMELREGQYGPEELTIATQLPLAIYVPPERMQVWQSGRSREKINRIRRRHPGIELDILRQYKLIYGWIRGKDVVEILTGLGLRDQALLSAVEPMLTTTITDMAHKGFAVADMKPMHIIISEKHLPALAEQPDYKKIEYVQELVRSGQYSIIDYELLVRTPAHEEEVAASRRHRYLDDQRDRFIATRLPEWLQAIDILGVPYVGGHVESTGGMLWVVGRNGRLFDYFLPERWRRTQAWSLSAHNEVNYTFTKDYVHIVWKTSRVGELPPPDAEDSRSRRIREIGYNSPFEEFALSLHLNANGIPAIYVRAIYMTGTPKSEQSLDPRPYQRLRHLHDSEGQAVLRDDRNYITLRGYYNGPDKWVAEQSGPLYRPMDLQRAAGAGVITRNEAKRCLEKAQNELKNIGYDGSLLEENDLLVALAADHAPVRCADSLPEARISNFELLHKL